MWDSNFWKIPWQPFLNSTKCIQDKPAVFLWKRMGTRIYVFCTTTKNSQRTAAHCSALHFPRLTNVCLPFTGVTIVLESRRGGNVCACHSLSLWLRRETAETRGRERKSLSCVFPHKLEWKAKNETRIISHVGFQSGAITVNEIFLPRQDVVLVQVEAVAHVLTGTLTCGRNAQQNRSSSFSFASTRIVSFLSFCSYRGRKVSSWPGCYARFLHTNFCTSKCSRVQFNCKFHFSPFAWVPSDADSDYCDGDSFRAGVSGLETVPLLWTVLSDEAPIQAFAEALVAFRKEGNLSSLGSFSAAQNFGWFMNPAFACC